MSTRGNTNPDLYALSAPLPEGAEDAFGALTRFPRFLRGNVCGEEMRLVGYRNWKQIEWIGWYAEFWAEAHLGATVPFHDNIPEEHRGILDARYEIDWDLKTHVLFNAKGAPNLSMPLNDKAAIDAAIARDGAFGLVVVDGVATFGPEYEEWRVAAAGGLSKAQQFNRAQNRRRRARKDTFTVNSVDLYVISAADMANLKTLRLITDFKQGRQHSGEARAVKYMMKISQIAPTLSFPLNVSQATSGDPDIETDLARILCLTNA